MASSTVYRNVPADFTKVPYAPSAPRERVRETTAAPTPTPLTKNNLESSIAKYKTTMKKIQDKKRQIKLI